MGSLSGGNQCIKILVFIFNFLFFLIGCGLLGTGIWLKVGKQDYLDVSQELSDLSKYITAGNLMIAVGAIIMIVAFFGCCGAIKESACLLLVFFIFLLLIFIMELAFGIFAYVKKDDVEEQLEKDFKDAIKKKYSPTDTNIAVNKVIDDFQRKFECCGYDSFQDWRDSVYHKNTSKIPDSCCIKTGGCNKSFNPDDYYKKGCFNEVMEYFKDNIVVVGSIGVAFAVIQILGMIFSMMLYRAIKSSGTFA